MTDTIAKQNCGSCRWFVRRKHHGPYAGHCTAPLPMWVVERLHPVPTRCVLRIDGEDCEHHSAKARAREGVGA